MKQGFLIFLFFTSLDAASYVPRFVFVVPAYNVRPWVKKNLDSLLSQKYPFYRVIFIDDSSEDGTSEFVSKYLAKFDKKKRVSFIKNCRRRGQLANVYRAVHSCENDEIIFVVDGDDWLAGKLVLSHMSMVYRQKNPWVTHGNFIYYAPHKKKKRRLHETVCNVRPFPQKVLKNRTIREYQRKTSHIATRVRTFYAWLFKQIATKDLLYEKFFFPAATDPAYMIPMIEMAGTQKVLHICEPHYVYNLENPLSYHAFKNGTNLQVKMMHDIWKKPSYPQLTRLTRQEISSIEIICACKNSADESNEKENFWNLDTRSTSIQNLSKDGVIEYFNSLTASHILLIKNIDCLEHIDINSCSQFFLQTKADIIFFGPDVKNTELYINPHFVAGKAVNHVDALFVQKDWLLEQLKDDKNKEDFFNLESCNSYTYYQ